MMGFCWIGNPVVVSHRSIWIYHIFKNDDADCGIIREHIYGTSRLSRDDRKGKDTSFDIRDFSGYRNGKPHKSILLEMIDELLEKRENSFLAKHWDFDLYGSPWDNRRELISEDEFNGTPPYYFRVVAVDKAGQEETISGNPRSWDFENVAYAKDEGIKVALCLAVAGKANGRNIMLRIEDTKGACIDEFNCADGRWNWDGVLYEDGGISLFEKIIRILHPG